MTGEPVDEQSLQLLRELYATPVGRRWVLKAGLGSAVALGAELYAKPAAAAAKRLTGVAPAAFHFRLGSLPGVSDLVLVANGARIPLARHTRTTHAAMRRSSRFWRAADLSTLTHHVSGIDLPRARPLLMTVVGRRGRRTVVVAQKWHVPPSATSRLASTAYRLSGSMAAALGSSRHLDALGVEVRNLRRPEAAVLLGQLGSVDDSAFGLVSVHPNIATVAPEEYKITENLLIDTPEVEELANHIEAMQEQGRDYSTFELGRHADGTPYELTIPRPNGEPPLRTTFEVFELNKRDGQLRNRLRSAVSVGITTVRDTARLGAVIDRPLVDERSSSSRTWIQPEGVRPVVRNHEVALKRSRARTAAKNRIDINIKNEGLNFGTYVARNGEYANGKVPLKIYNNYVRWVSVYVQYLGAENKNLSHNESAEAPDTKYAKSLGLMPQVFTILGIPLWDTNTIEVELEFPKGSHVARLLMCGLGGDIKGDGWRQYFPKDAYPDRIAPKDEVNLPSVLTGLLTIGMNVFALATDIDIAIAWKGIRKTINAAELAKPSLSHVIRDLFLLGEASSLSLTPAEAIAAAVAAGSASYEDVKANGGGVGNLWNILLGLGSVIPKMLFSPAGGKLFAEIATSVWGLIAAERFVTAIPVIGEVIAVLTALGDAATLAEVCAETIVSPWVIENEVSLTYEATIKIERDPDAATWPATARSWRLEALVEGALTLDPVTGPINQGGKVGSAPLSIDVAAPFGGKDIQWSVVFLDGAGRQVGTGVSATYPNDDPVHPAREVSIVIKQLPAEITDKSVFKRSGTTTYDPAVRGYTWSDQVAVTGTVHRKGVQEVIDTAVATRAGVAGVVFKENDRFYIRGIPLAQDGKTIELGTARKEGFVRRPFVLLDPFVASNNRRNHFLLEPDGETEAYHVRQLSLDPKTGDIGWDPGVSLGTFTLPVSAAALHSSGRIVVVNTNRARIGTLQPAETPRAALASYFAGPGRRAGLLESPIAVAITNPGVVLVLEAGTAQIAAFDLNGNPTRYFKAPAGGELEFRRTLESKGRPLDMAVDGSDQIYVLYLTGDGNDPQDYRIDVYTKHGELFNRATSGANIPRFSIDYWRSIFAANYDALTELGTTTKRIDRKLGVPEPSLSRLDPE